MTLNGNFLYGKEFPLEKKRPERALQRIWRDFSVWRRYRQLYSYTLKKWRRKATVVGMK